MDASKPIFESLIAEFPGLAYAKRRRWQPIEHMRPGRTEAELVEAERVLGVPLPQSYRRFLRIAGGFSLGGSAVQFHNGHPFFHEFEKLSDLNEQQRERIAAKGGHWPPPSHGMLCFAEVFMLADGDQALFDVRGGLRDGEYPVYYYAHETAPATVTRVASGFAQFLNEFLQYQHW